MKTILLITSEFPPQPGGIGNHAYHLAQQLSLRYKVKVLADQRSQNGLEEKEFDQLQKFSSHRVQRYPFILWTYLLRLVSAFQSAKQADLILVSGKFSLWTGGLLSLFYSKPYVAIIHGSEVQLSNSLARGFTNWSLQRFDHVIGVSNFTLNLMSHLNLKQKSVIPNGFDLSQLNVVHKKPEYIEKSKSDFLQLITVGNLTQRKGQHNVLKALPLLIKTYPNLIYHIVGLPTDQERSKNLASKLKIEEYIRYHGRQAEEEKIKLLLASDVFMMLSEQTVSGDVEGFGIAILEANALGLPAVGSLNCGIEDAIKADYSGQLVDPHDPQAILEALDKITSQQETYAKHAKQWSTKFTWDKIGKQYVEILEEFFKRI